MKRVLVSVVVAGFLAFAVASSFSAQKPKPVAMTAEEKAKAKQEEKALAALSKKTAEQAKAKEKLSTHEWVINLTLRGEKSATAKTDTDILTFSNGTVTSSNLSGKGYGASNITVNIQDDGTIVWETMQTTDKGEMAFWRGELRNDVMSGILSMQNPKGASEEFFFASVKAEAKPAPAPAQPEPPATPAKPEKAAKPAKK